VSSPATERYARERGTGRQPADGADSRRHVASYHPEHRTAVGRPVVQSARTGESQSTCTADENNRV